MEDEEQEDPSNLRNQFRMLSVIRETEEPDEETLRNHTRIQHNNSSSLHFGGALQNGSNSAVTTPNERNSYIIVTTKSVEGKLFQMSNFEG